MRDWPYFASAAGDGVSAALRSPTLAHAGGWFATRYRLRHPGLTPSSSVARSRAREGWPAAGVWAAYELRGWATWRKRVRAADWGAGYAGSRRSSDCASFVRLSVCPSIV